MTKKPKIEDCQCKDVFTEEERKHLEEVLHGDLEGYWEEMKDMHNIMEFDKWRDLSAKILEKCNLNEWHYEGEPTEDEKFDFYANEMTEEAD